MTRHRARYGSAVVAAAAILLAGTSRAAPPRSSAVRAVGGFERNVGQADSRVTFLSRGRGHALFLTREGATLVTSPAGGPSSVLEMLPLGGGCEEAEGRDRLPGVTNRLLGRDSAAWRTGIPSYGRVACRGVWPGIDVVFRSAGGAMEYDLVIAPGADASRARFVYRGAAGLRVDEEGSLCVATPAGELIHHRPVAWETAGDGQRPLPASWTVSSDGVAALKTGPRDDSLPLVIDPLLSYSSYLGGRGVDAARAVAVDGSGNIFVTGSSSSIDFPVTVGAPGSTLSGGGDVFVAKFDPSGSVRLWATYLGGGGTDAGNGIAVDAAGAPYVVGETNSQNFPVTAGAAQTTLAAGSENAFVAKLNPSGTLLVYATFLGGSGVDQGSAIAVDGAGHAYVSGRAGSLDFPTTAGAFQTSPRGALDAFVTKVAPSGGSWVYSTYLGGVDNDSAHGIAVDGTGTAFVTGGTRSPDFPTTPGAFRSSNLSTDAFVVRLDPSGSGILFGTFLGGSFVDRGNAIAVEGTGVAWVAGQTSSTDFPRAGGPLQAVYGGGPWDAFLARVDATASGVASVPYSTFLGGSGEDRASAISVSPAGILLAGFTSSANFPSLGATQGTYGGGALDAFVTQFSPMAKPILFSTFLGGSGSDSALGAALAPSGELVVAGQTDSLDFSLAAPFQPTPGGGGDAFVALYGPSAPPPGPTPTPAVRPPASIPALGDEAMALLLVALGCAGFIFLRRG